MTGIKAPLPAKDSKRVTILGIPVDGVTMPETLDQVQDFMGQARLHQIATVNPEFIMTAQQDPDFRDTLLKADLCLPDGVGLLLAGRKLKKAIPERVAGSDLVYRLAHLASQNKWRLFLLGAETGVAEEAAGILKDRYAGLIIAGTYAGSPNPAENQFIVEMVNSSKADILFVAYGAPKQDKWIARNKISLTTVRVAIGIGGSLDFITGRATRAPRWVQRIGLEWLHRLVKEPWRWRRMLALPRFALRVLFYPE